MNFFHAVLYLCKEGAYNISIFNFRRSEDMKKIFFSLYLSGALALFAHNAAAQNSLPLENLEEYNIRLISSEQGISAYSGVNDGLQLKIEASNGEILKIVLMFDFNNGGAKRSAYAMETIKIVANLMPQKIISLTEAQDMLYKKLAAMNAERDKDVFTFDGLRFECNCINGMMNIRVTQ